MPLDEDRLRIVNDAARNPRGDYVVYWMTAARRPSWNLALDHAASIARRHQVPLVVFEPLRVGYRWASPRLHQFIVEGMAANSQAFSGGPVLYYPYLEPEEGAGKGLLRAMSRRAVSVVTDDFPAFFLPAMLHSAGRQLEVSLEAVDGNGLLPMRTAPKLFSRAYDFRRFLQRNLREHLDGRPQAAPPRDVVAAPAGLLAELGADWAPADLTKPVPDLVQALPLAGDAHPVDTPGGAEAGEQRLNRFVVERLGGYLERNHPDDDPSSRLSPYLHFGHVGAHQVFAAVARQEAWDEGRIGDRRDGGREGWWGMSPAAEGFLDQVVTWRELGLNMCSFDPDYASFERLPGWAQKTLHEHTGDTREYLYGLEDFEAAATHDEIWNAAQRELLREGRIHNYLRMLWGKKILEWTASPHEALEIMIHLNNKYALDGRDPNS